MTSNPDVRAHLPADEALETGDGLLPEDLQGLTLDDVEAILAAPDTLAARHDRLVALRDQLETLSHAMDDTDAGALGRTGSGTLSLIRSIDGALQRLEHARAHPGGRPGMGFDPDARADIQSPEDLLSDNWRLSIDPTHGA